MSAYCTYQTVKEWFYHILTTMIILVVIAGVFNLYGCMPNDGVLLPEDGGASFDEKDPISSMTFTGEFNAVMDVYGKDAESILSDRALMEQVVDPDYEFISEITEMADGWIEVRAKIPELTITINDRSTTLDENGQFFFEDIAVQLGDFITISYDGMAYMTHEVTEVDIESQDVFIEDRFDFDTYVSKKNCNCTDDSCPLESSAREFFPCLDNNGYRLWGFFRSDCYMSLFHGPAAYSWMCWAEAMNSIHDHHGNIWCNGTHNCSLFVHNWDWGCQRWHTHSGSWTVGSGC